ncbi:carboxymuconolactone decarboxylase family protein [Paraburkholderia sp. SARCC-3016]|uniref:carboxymuconolactone decarboxylase family protein n=1 Tax=Paraburkholderia sp. SARCC-3016 TaxID=3058611 RepID=UPI002808CD3D|nr:carboxymuconolactone decarboxylase family protein [Paraburkholderia sp. SARCC-3016]MDQ7978135.1 carboxymuconolactone decarboxylase family protein [Paraburkholderia sp. SARCC-3016]
MAVIRTIGDEGFDSLSAALDRLDPDFKRLLVEGGYAEIIARPKLALKHRELVTVAVLATMGNADSAFKYHASGMLNTGWSAEELLETVLHTSVYAGIPVALAGIRIVCAMLAERGIDVTHKKSPFVREMALRETNLAQWLRSQHEQFDSLPAELREILANVAYGTALNRPALSIKDRQLATLAITMARENQWSAVRLHLRACIRLGWTRSELTEVLIQLTGYIGWPLVLPITRIALEVFDETTGEDLSDAAMASEQAEQVEARMEHLPADKLSAFALPKDIADLSPLIAQYLAQMGSTTRRFDSIDAARASRLSDVACLTCLARNADAEVLGAHVREALTLGASRRDIADAILSALPHAGVLAVEYGLNVASRIFATIGASEREERKAS